MSEPTFASLAILTKGHLTSCYGAEAALALTGEQIARHPLHGGSGSPYYRRLQITSAGHWFQHKLGEIQRLAGIGGLAFLREDAPTHRHTQTYKDDAGRTVHTELHHFAVLRLDWAAEQAALAALMEWCRTHAEQAGDVLEVGTQWVQPAIDARFYTLDPSMEGLGDGDNPEFFFSVLHTLEEMMRFMVAHKDRQHLLVIYHWQP